MPRGNATAPPDAIRIEDEVWQEAFSRREPGQTKARRRLQAVDGDRTSSTLEAHATALDRTSEPAEVRDWLAAVTADSAASSNGSLGDASGADLRSDSSGAGSLTAMPSRPVPSPGASPARRTVIIRGRGAEGHLPWPDASRSRPQRRAHERAGFRPDRLAMWAVLLGFLLVLVAILSAH